VLCSAADVSSTPEAVLLDMGSYRLPSSQMLDFEAAAGPAPSSFLLASRLRQLAAAVPAASSGTSSCTRGFASAAKSQREGSAAANKRSVMKPSSSTPTNLRVYQVLHPTQVSCTELS